MPFFKHSQRAGFRECRDESPMVRFRDRSLLRDVCFLDGAIVAKPRESEAEGTVEQALA